MEEDEEEEVDKGVEGAETMAAGQHTTTLEGSDLVLQLV